MKIKFVLFFTATFAIWSTFSGWVCAQTIPRCHAEGVVDSDISAVQAIQDTLLDGSLGPQMILLPKGKFAMGDTVGGGKSYEIPVHEVTLAYCFSIGKFPVTFSDYDKFTAATGKPLVSDYHWGRNDRPVINVSLQDAQDYAAWLSAQTGLNYRLPSEAEWEYAARAGTNGKYPWGDDVGQGNALCRGCGASQPQKMTVSVGQFPANPWGLFDMQGNVWELTADCWNFNYENAPKDGRAWRTGDCTRSVLRGGSWGDTSTDLRSSTRLRSYSGTRTIVIGFRVVRDL